jgi:tetratricopeptide (TPR) repeat protein
MRDMTFNLVELLLARGRRCQEQGRLREAAQLLCRLAAFRELPGKVAEEVQSRLAEVQLQRRKYQRARRHVNAALAHDPRNARYLHLMGAAFATGEGSNLPRSIECYRKALEIEPDQVECLCECGLLEVREGHTEEGLARLRKAIQLAPDNAGVLAKLAKGLRLAGRSDEARSELPAALFRNPRNPRFRKLWNEYQFKELRRRQELERRNRLHARPIAEGPVLLPFVRPVDRPPVATDGSGPGTDDGPESVPGPQRPRPATRPDQKNVQ